MRCAPSPRRTPATGSDATAGTERPSTGSPSPNKVPAGSIVSATPGLEPEKQILRGMGEDLALRYLIQHGYTLVERNYRTRRGEVDLIVRKDEALVLVLRNKAIPNNAANIQGAVGRYFDREPEH